MVLLTLSASHHELDLDLLEQLSTGAHSVGPMIVADSSIAGCVVLATCNRFEVYLDVDQDVDVAVKAATSAVAHAAGLAPDHTEGVLRLKEGTGPVARHLFGVAAGLDSMVFGEREVVGQVRRALAAARADRTTTASLELLFQRASRASRSVRTPGLGTAGRSVVAVALDLAAEHLTLPGAHVLLIGTGSYARTAVGALRARGVRQISVHSPSGRASTFAKERSLIAVEPGAVEDHLAEADLVVACSGATGPVLGVGEVLRARDRGNAGRRGPLVLVDLALRHDIEPAVGEMPGVRLLDLAGVQARTPTAPEVGDGWGIIEPHVEGLSAALAERELIPAVSALREHVHAILDAELRRAKGSPEAERALQRLAASLLHTPMVRARGYARRGESKAYLDALATLLGVTPRDRP